MAERRKNERIRSTLQGAVEPDGRRPSLPCAVRDMSAGGLRIETDKAALIPSLFDFVLPSRKVSFRARIRWRTAVAAGIELLSPARAAGVPLAVSLRQRTLDRARGALRRRLAAEPDGPGRL